MGYSIYYKTIKPLTKEEVAKCVKAIRKIIKENSEVIEIEFKEKESNNDYNINFNAKSVEGAYETFCFYSRFAEKVQDVLSEALDNDKPSDLDKGVISLNGNLLFQSCKTRRHPYDALVKKALIECQKITGDKFEISCDDGFKYTSKGAIEE